MLKKLLDEALLVKLDVLIVASLMPCPLEHKGT